MSKLDPGPCDAPFSDRASLAARGDAAELPERADELRALRDALSPSLAGEDAVGVVIYGPAGAGKTELALQAASAFGDADGSVVHLECGVDDTAFACCRRIANALGADLPASGLSVDRAKEAARDRLRDAAGPRCLVLDDAEVLDGDVRRTLLLEVLDRLESAALATIATSGTLSLRNELERRELAVLGDSERVIDHYDADELRSILERRARSAFDSGAVDDELIAAVVDAAAERDYDAGFALELLATAGDLACEDGSEVVSSRHLDRAQDRVAVGALAAELQDLRNHHRFALRGVCSLARAGETPARVGTVFRAYVEACDGAGVEPNTERSLQNYLRRLVEVDLLEAEEVRTDAGGKFNRYELARRLDAVKSALDAAA